MPAKTLLLLVLIGGWLGAKLSHLWFRHTSEQRPFRIMPNLTLLPILGLVDYFATQKGIGRL